MTFLIPVISESFRAIANLDGGRGQAAWLELVM